MNHNTSTPLTRTYAAKSVRQAHYADMQRQKPTDRGRFFMTGQAGYLDKKHKEERKAKELNRESLLCLSAGLMENITKTNALNENDKKELVALLDKSIRKELGPLPEGHDTELAAYAKYSQHLKKCKMCGKWFVHRNKNAQYCNRVNKQDPHGRTCQQLGPPNDYNEKVSKSALLLEYRRFNARMNYEIQKGKITFEEFDEQILMAKVRKNAIIKEYGPNPPEKVVREYSEALRKQ